MKQNQLFGPKKPGPSFKEETKKMEAKLATLRNLMTKSKESKYKDHPIFSGKPPSRAGHRFKPSYMTNLKETSLPEAAPVQKYEPMDFPLEALLEDVGIGTKAKVEIKEEEAKQEDEIEKFLEGIKMEKYYGKF